MGPGDPLGVSVGPVGLGRGVLGLPQLQGAGISGLGVPCMEAKDSSRFWKGVEAELILYRKLKGKACPKPEARGGGVAYTGSR